MAIRRCPYCKAIIDEGLEYCSNCGTQLIFPEDEFIDEEIPGEKVVDVTDEGSEPEEEKLSKDSEDLTAAPDDIEAEKTEEIEEGELKAEDSELIEEGELEVPASEVAGEEEIAPEEEEDIIPQTEETFVETDELEEEPKVEIESAEIPDEGEKSESVEEDSLPAKDEEQLSDDLEKPVEEAIPDSEEIDQVEDVFSGEEEETGEITAESDSIDFKTEDLEKIVDPAEKEKEEIEQFLNSLKEEREKTKKYYEETGELPPWAQSMKEGSIASMTSDEEIKEAEEALSTEEEKLIEKEKFIEEEMFVEEEKSIEKEETLEEETPPAEEVSVPADTGMGLPEKIDQKGLPFTKDFHEDELEEEAGSHFRDRNMGFPSWIKSRIFDVLMIVGLWLVTVWLASVVANASFFKLITISTIPILIFLAILLTVYFFLFFFFLGETLGDQLFSQEE